MNIEYRPIRNTDYDLLSTPFTEASVSDGRPSRQVGEEAREEFESLPVDLETQTISAWRGGQLAGATYVYHLSSADRQGMQATGFGSRPDFSYMALSPEDALVEWRRI